MTRLRPLRPRDGLGVAALLALTGTLYAGGGRTAAAFGLATAGAWLFGPPVFAFVLGQAGVAVALSPASIALLAVGEAALAAVLFSDVAVSEPAPTWSPAVLAGGIAAGAAVVASSTSILLAATVIVAGLGAVSYALHRYAGAIAADGTEGHA